MEIIFLYIHVLSLKGILFLVAYTFEIPLVSPIRSIGS